MPNLEREQSSIPIEEDNDDSWIPLKPSQNEKQIVPHSLTTQVIQRRLETRITLKRNLVDHPIDLFWKRYLINVLKEFFRLHVSKQVGVIFFLSGVCLKIFLISTWYFWYPKLAFSLCALGLSLCYFDPFDHRQQLQHLFSIFLAPENAAHAIEQLDMAQLRYISCCLLLVPTLLEVRTISFLSQVHVESGWNVYNTILSIVILSNMLYQLKRNYVASRDCIYQGLLILYGSALLVTIIQYDIGRMPILAAPFLTAAGALMITYNENDEWIARLLRHSLRLTLRDVLTSVSEKVSTDEMLQLTILRWIADYWACTPPSSSTSSSQSESNLKTKGTAKSTHGAKPSPNERDTSNQSLIPRLSEENTLQWEELLPMLSLAADHMTSEMHLLQQNTEDPKSIRLRTEDDRNDAVAGLKSMLLSLNVDERAKPAVNAYRKAIESFPPSRMTATMVSIVRRCPAVLALLWHVFFVASGSIYSSTVLILPFVVLEYFRVKSWVNTVCNHTDKSLFLREKDIKPNTWQQMSSVMEEADAMAILLLGDTFSYVRPPSLLVVWNNILGSISALEFGLTAARCAQTTTVAMEFAGNVMSLVNLGLEVKNNGLLHGVGVMTKEFLSMRDNNLSNTTRFRRQHGNSTKYTSAALGLVQNSQVFASNMKTLVQEQDTMDPVLRPVLWTLCKVSGHGIFWGKGNESEDNVPSEGAEPSMVDDEDDEDKTQESSQESSKENEMTPSKLKVSDLDGRKELAEVMDMVSLAFEQGLIDQEEKDTFCSKLSALSENELFDSSVVTGMKRTIQIILQNGQSLEEPIVEATDPQEEKTIADTEKYEISEEAEAIGANESNKSDLPEQNIKSEEAEKEESHDAWLKFGIGALGVVIGGVLLSKQGNESNDEHEIPHYQSRSEKWRNTSSTVQIEELNDDNEDEWIDVSDTNKDS